MFFVFFSCYLFVFVVVVVVVEGGGGGVKGGGILNFSCCKRCVTSTPELLRNHITVEFSRASLLF